VRRAPAHTALGRSYDNALAESEEIYRRGPWKGVEDIEFATLEWVAWYNRRRLLEPLGYVSPMTLSRSITVTTRLQPNWRYSRNRVLAKPGDGSEPLGNWRALRQSHQKRRRGHGRRAGHLSDCVDLGQCRDRQMPLHCAGIGPRSDSTSAMTSVEVRAARPPLQPGHGPLYAPAVAVACLMRSFIGHGQSGCVVWA
jgi:hypothetical protein